MSGGGTIYEYQRELTARLEQITRERDEARSQMRELAEVAARNVNDASHLRRTACELERERDEARAEVERLRDLLPVPPDGGGLPRYGMRWNGPTEPLPVPMDDGYWTPWHLAYESLCAVAERQREACAKAIRPTNEALAYYQAAELVLSTPLVTEVEP